MPAMTVLDSCWWSPMPPMHYVGAVAINWEDKPGTYSAYIGTYTDTGLPQKMTEDLIASRGARLTEEHAKKFFPAIAADRRYVVGD